MLKVLKDTRYLRLFTAQVVALLGTGILTVALGLRAFDIAEGNAGVVLGTVLTIKMAAYVLIAPVAAAVLASIPRRRVLVTADLVRTTVALGLPFVDQAWQIYLLVGILQCASAVFTPTFTAIIPEILDEDEYTSALALSRLAYDLESLVSPLITAGLLVFISSDALFFATVAGFAGSALFVVSVALPPPSVRTASSSVWERTAIGTKTMLRVPQLRVLVALNAAIAAVVGLVLVNTVVWVQQLLDRSEGSVALAMAAFGTGSMVVALLLRVLLIRFDALVLCLYGGASSSIALTVAALLAGMIQPSAVGWGSLLGLWFVLGASSSLMLTPSARVIRDYTAAGNLPLVFAAQFSLSHLCFAFTYPTVGIIGAHYGHGAAASLMAAVAAIATAIAAMTWLRHVRTPPAGAPAEQCPLQPAGANSA